MGKSRTISDLPNVTTNSLTEKLALVDADLIRVSDSAASFAEKKTTWSNIKSVLKTYFDSIYANLTSPTFLGTPLAPTATVGTNTTQIATTAFTKAEITAMASGENVSLSANGYQKMPNGLIIQWGVAEAGVNTITFPIAFTTACYSVTLSAIYTNNDNDKTLASAPTTTGVALTGSISMKTYYMAVGV